MENGTKQKTALRTCFGGWCYTTGLFLAAWKVDSASSKNNIHLEDFNHHNFTPTAGNSKPRFPGPFLAVHPKTEVMGHSSEKKTHHLPHSNPPPKKKTHRRKTWMIFLPTGGLVHHTKWYTCVHNTEKANNFFSAKTYPGLQYPMDPIIHDGHHRLSPRNRPEIIAWRSSFRMKKRFRRLRFSWVPKRRPIGMSIRSKRNISCGHGMALWYELWPETTYDDIIWINNHTWIIFTYLSYNKLQESFQGFSTHAWPMLHLSHPSPPSAEVSILKSQRRWTWWTSNKTWRRCFPRMEMENINFSHEGNESCFFLPESEKETK